MDNAIQALREARRQAAAERAPIAQDVQARAKDLAARRAALVRLDELLAEYDQAIAKLEETP